jgi:hypothetical protein
LSGADITCSGATYNYSTFPAGAQSVLETIYVDGAVVKQTTFDFTGPTGTDTLQFSVPNDGAQHYIEAYSYSITNSTPVSPSPNGTATLTCGAPPPPPPVSVCTYTQGYYKNHPAAVTGVPVGSMNLSAAQAQAVLNGNAVANGSSSPKLNSNLLLVLAKQLITAELNVARGSAASAGVQSAIASANAAITTTLVGGTVTLSSQLSNSGASTLVDALDAFNSGSDCH